jgi:molybdopterin-guanine dinucleotide biosynthesis protein A
MAQGEGRRLRDLGKPKQLLEINGESILHRIVRMVGEIKPDASVVVVGWPELAGAKNGAQLVTLSAPGYCILDGLLEARQWWTPVDIRDRCVVLLGDVVFSRHALTQILCDQRELVFAGTTDICASEGELFAVAWSWAQTAHVLHLLEHAPCRVDSRGGNPKKYPRPQGGHLRRLLWEAQRSAGLKIPAKQQWHPEMYLPISDWTWDIDDDADLQRIPRLEREAAREGS